MKNLIDVIKWLFNLFLEIPAIIDKRRIISIIELKVAELKYCRVLDDSGNIDDDIKDGERLLKAVKNCPPSILVYEMKRLSYFDEEDITESICIKLVERIELMSCDNLNK